MPHDEPWDEIHLTDGVIDLHLETKDSADPSRGHVSQYHYWIALHGSSERVGSIRLRIGEHPSLLIAGHVGYDIAEAHRGQRFAGRARRLLGPVARAHGMHRLLFTCDPQNIASRRTCERIGAKFSGIVDVPEDHEMYHKGVRRVCRYEWALGAAD